MSTKLSQLNSEEAFRKKKLTSLLIPRAAYADELFVQPRTIDEYEEQLRFHNIDKDQAYSIVQMLYKALVEAVEEAREKRYAAEREAQDLERELASLKLVVTHQAEMLEKLESLLEDTRATDSIAKHQQFYALAKSGTSGPEFLIRLLNAHDQKMSLNDIDWEPKQAQSLAELYAAKLVDLTMGDVRLTEAGAAIAERIFNKCTDE